MVTGDHPETAEAIAKQVYIIRSPTRRDLALKRRVPIAQVCVRHFVVVRVAVVDVDNLI